MSETVALRLNNSHREILSVRSILASLVEVVPFHPLLQNRECQLDWVIVWRVRRQKLDDMIRVLHELSENGSCMDRDVVEDDNHSFSVILLCNSREQLVLDPL